MLQTLQRTWENIVKPIQRGTQRCSDHDCCRAGLSLLKARPRGMRIEDSWFCSPECIRRALQTELRRCINEVYAKPRPLHRMPLGLLMLSRGFVSEAQVQSALLAQRRAGRGKIGQWLQTLGFATEKQVVTALALQYAMPVLAFPSELVPQKSAPARDAGSLANRAGAVFRNAAIALCGILFSGGPQAASIDRKDDRLANVGLRCQRCLHEQAVGKHRRTR